MTLVFSPGWWTNAFQDFKGYQSAPFFSWGLWNPVSASYNGESTTGLNSVLSVVFWVCYWLVQVLPVPLGIFKLMNGQALLIGVKMHLSAALCSVCYMQTTNIIACKWLTIQGSGECFSGGLKTQSSPKTFRVILFVHTPVNGNRQNLWPHSVFQWCTDGIDKITCEECRKNRERFPEMWKCIRTQFCALELLILTTYLLARKYFNVQSRIPVSSSKGSQRGAKSWDFLWVSICPGLWKLLLMRSVVAEIVLVRLMGLAVSIVVKQKTMSFLVGHLG